METITFQFPFIENTKIKKKLKKKKKKKKKERKENKIILRN
jgi:hypothetical protein